MDDVLYRPSKNKAIDSEFKQFITFVLTPKNLKSVVYTVKSYLSCP